MNGEGIKIEVIQTVNVKRDAWIRGFIDRAIMELSRGCCITPPLLFLSLRRKEYFERRVRNQKKVMRLPDLFGAEKAQMFEVGNVNAGGAADPWL